MDTRRLCLFIGIVLIELSSSRGQNLMRELQNARTAEDFLQYVNINGRPGRLSDVYIETDTTDDDGDVVYVSGGLTLARPDECSPRLTTVEIPRSPDDINVVYWPKCTRIERCGGCCVTNMLRCYPTNIETVELHVLKAVLPFPGAMNLDWLGPMPVVLERHLDCTSICKQTPDDCNESQRFSEIDCMCRCINEHSCHVLKMWHEPTCTCRCRTVTNCGASTFNHETCRCEIQQGASEIHYSSDNGGSESGSPPESGGQAQVTTPAADQPFDPCLVEVCPPNFSKRIDPTNSNTCLCTPPFLFPGK